MDISSTARKWLEGTVLVGFSYMAGYTLRFERNQRSKEIPNVLVLYIHSRARFKGPAQGLELQQLLRRPPSRVDLEEVALAHRIMLLIGVSVLSIEVSASGDLSIAFEDGSVLSIEGRTTEYDESWVIMEPIDAVREAQRIVSCDSAGTLYLGSVRKPRQQVS